MLMYRQPFRLLVFIGLLGGVHLPQLAAQVMSVGLSPAIAIPVNLRSNEFTLGVGAALTFKYPFTERWHVISQASDYHFFASEPFRREWGVRSTNHLNLQAGVTYHFLTEVVQPYLGFHTGITFSFIRYTELSGLDQFTQVGLRFPFSPTGGVYFRVTKDFAIDLNLAASISAALFAEAIASRGTSVFYLSSGFVYFPVGLGFMYRLDLDSPKFQLRGG